MLNISRKLLFTSYFLYLLLLKEDQLVVRQRLWLFILSIILVALLIAVWAVSPLLYRDYQILVKIWSTWGKV